MLVTSQLASLVMLLLSWKEVQRKWEWEWEIDGRKLRGIDGCSTQRMGNMKEGKRERGCGLLGLGCLGGWPCGIFQIPPSFLCLSLLDFFVYRGGWGGGACLLQNWRKILRSLCVWYKRAKIRMLRFSESGFLWWAKNGWNVKRRDMYIRR